jgi:3-polyprenyl-4-hydroxybenzoate decarboxylase
MLAVTEAGALIMPPLPAFYTKPDSVEDLVNQTVLRVLDQLNLPSAPLKRWKR